MRTVCPNLRDDNHRITSPNEPLYNCVAWSVENQLFWIWPDPDNQYGWPVGIARTETLEAFAQFYELLGYQPCPDASLEEGFGKIALYARDGAPTHVARQLGNGRWTSKLGDLVDIEHVDLSVVSDGAYGKPVQIMRRPRAMGPLILPTLHPPPGLVTSSGAPLRSK